MRNILNHSIFNVFISSWPAKYFFAKIHQKLHQESLLYISGNLNTATSQATSNQPYSIYLQKKLRPIPPQGLIQNGHDNEEEPTETPTLSHTTPRMTFTAPTEITIVRSTKAVKPPTNPSPRTSPPTVQKATSSPMTKKSTISEPGETASTATPPNTTPSPVDLPDIITTVGPPGGPDFLVTFGPPGPPGDLDKTSPPDNAVYGASGSDSATASNNNYGPPSIWEIDIQEYHNKETSNSYSLNNNSRDKDNSDTNNNK